MFLLRSLPIPRNQLGRRVFPRGVTNLHRVLDDVFRAAKTVAPVPKLNNLVTVFVVLLVVTKIIRVVIFRLIARLRQMWDDRDSFAVRSRRVWLVPRDQLSQCVLKFSAELPLLERQIHHLRLRGWHVCLFEGISLV
jgi:hypothetical protein